MTERLSSAGAQSELTETLQGIVGRGEKLAQALALLESEPRPFDVSYKDDLLDMIARIEKFASDIEKTADKLDPSQVQLWLESLDRILATWTSVNEAVDSTVTLAVKGKLDKRFFFLSPIANCANLSERMRLRRLQSRLTDQVRCAGTRDERELEPCAVADPDLLGVRSVARVPAEAAKHRSVRLGPVAMKDMELFTGCLARLGRDDELDRNEALIDIVRQHQHLLVARMLKDPNGSEDVELRRSLDVMSRHAELVLLEDYFFSARRMKLSHLLASFEVGPSGALFRDSLWLFHGTGLNVREAVAPFERRNREALETGLRIMLIHPTAEYRSFATKSLAPWQFWPVVSYPRVPVAALDDVSKRLMADDVSDDYRRVFFDCTYKRLLEAQTEPQVRWAREIINRYFTLDFFLEDHYFLRLQRLNERMELHEKRFGIENRFFKQSLEAFLKEKDRIGSRKTQLPKSFVDIPLTVQRKLAREGHYLSWFIRHPRPKIALETLRFLDTSAKIEKVLKLRTTNRHVVREIAKKEDLLLSYKALLALLYNPHAPIKVAMKHLPSVRGEDVKRLAASRDINPELSTHLRRRLQRAHR